MTYTLNDYFLAYQKRASSSFILSSLDSIF